MHCPLVSYARTTVLGPPALEGGGSKSGPAMSGVPMNNRVVVKRDPPEHGFGLWPGSGKVAGKVLILDLSKGPAKILILLYLVPV